MRLIRQLTFGKYFIERNRHLFIVLFGFGIDGEHTRSLSDSYYLFARQQPVDVALERRLKVDILYVRFII